MPMADELSAAFASPWAHESRAVVFVNDLPLPRSRSHFTRLECLTQICRLAGRQFENGTPAHGDLPNRPMRGTATLPS